MEYSEELTVFERVLQYNKIQEIKGLERKAEEEQINEAKNRTSKKGR